MKEQQGYIALFRQFLSWEWFTDINTCHLFIYCLLRANHKAKKWRGITVPAGSFITSLNHISLETGLTLQQCRTALNHLKSTYELTHQSTRQYSIITVNNWDKWQGNQHTNQQTINKQLTTNNNDNNSTINTSYINTHTIKKCVCENSKEEISKEDKKILRMYAKNNGAKNISAYVHQLIVNGGYIEILESEKKKAEKRRAEQARFLIEKENQEQEPELTEEERQKALERARKLAGIDKKRRGKKL